MKSITVGAAMLLATAPPALAVDFTRFIPGYLTAPPAEYDHHYEGHLVIKRANDVQELRVMCAGASPTSLACAAPGRDSCTIVIASDDLLKAYGWSLHIIMRHEIGHCNGWPGNHPGMRLAR